MVEFIVNNYYVILVVCILLIFAIIGYIIDTLKRRKYEENFANDSYVAEEEIFIKNFEDKEVVLQEQKDNSIDEMLKEYNEEQQSENSL